MLSAEASNSIPHSITESQFSTVMPYVEDSGQTSNNVFLETSSSIDPHVSQQISQSPIHTDTSKVSSPIETPPEQSPAQGEVPEAQGEHPLYVLGGSLPIVLGLPTCQTTLHTDRPYLSHAMPNIVFA